MDKETLKEKIIFGLKFLKEQKLNLASEGNISIRTKQGFFISPSAQSPDKIKAKDIVFIDQKGFIKGSTKPSSEWKMHLLIYKKKKDINAIVHSHSVWASSLSCVRERIPPFHYMVAEFGGDDILCAKYALFGSNKIAENVLDALNNRKGCLMENHGQITIGKTFEEAISLCEALEKISKQYSICKILGDYKLLNDQEMNEVISLFSNYKPKY
ncbi:class II aldolase/adducin family protein [Rickettsiales bacterium]|nr:class II aldolase/adducin family protein [Rickettsiales bacterium]